MSTVSPDSAQRERERLAARSRAMHSAAADVGQLQPVADPKRRARCERDLHAFLVEYFPNGTGQSPFGDKQVEAIKHLEHCILKGGRRINLLPRGYCKSSISEGACIWATLYGHRRFVMFLGANETEAQTGIESIQRELSDNDLLMADFPEVCQAVRHLGGQSQRARSQHQGGKLTHIEWTASCVVFPEIEGSKASGAIITADGLLSAHRGSRHKRADGSTARPDFVVIDDPQTDQSASSPTETAKRIRVLRKSIMRLSGHGKQVAICINATQICGGDMIDVMSDRKEFPNWQIIRSPTVISMPDALETHWLKEYARLLRTFDPTLIDGQQQALAAATRYYQANRQVMDAGAEVCWEHVGLEDGEVSAIQHALNILILEGAETFASECQNQPLRAISSGSLELSADIARNVSGFGHRVIPEQCQLVCGIDCHDELLYFVLAAVRSDFTGYIVDYGTWPEQANTHFLKANAKQTLSWQYPNEDPDSILGLAIEDLLHWLLSNEWRDANGEQVGMGGICVDVGYRPSHVRAAIQRCMPKARIVLGSQGVGCGVSRKPFPEFDMSKAIRKQPGPRPRWYLPHDKREGDLYGVLFDSYFWKDVLAGRLLSRRPEGRWLLYGDESTDHSHIVSHWCAERPTLITGNGRSVNQWEVTAGRDNHWWDCATLCCVAASLCGCQLPIDRMPVIVPPPQPYREPEHAISAADESWLMPDGRSFFAFNR